MRLYECFLNHEACQVIQHGLKDEPGKLDIKDANMVLYFKVSKVNKLIRSDRFLIAAKWSAKNSTYLVCRSEFTSWYALQTSH